MERMKIVVEPLDAGTHPDLAERIRLMIEDEGLTRYRLVLVGVETTEQPAERPRGYSPLGGMLVGSCGEGASNRQASRQRAGGTDTCCDRGAAKC